MSSIPEEIAEDVVDTETETDTDMETTSLPERVAESDSITLLSQQPLSGKQQELELLAKREREDREIEERVTTPVDCIQCKRCKEIMPPMSRHCHRCKAYNILNESDTPEDKRTYLIQEVVKLLKPLQVAFENKSVKITARVVDNTNARGGQANRKPKSIQWKREFARRLDRWEKNDNILADATVERWWNEWLYATNEVIQAGYTVEEFTEIIPELQRLVDDKKSGQAAPTSFMTREERLRIFAMANVPIIISNQRGGDTTRLFDEATFIQRTLC